MMRTNPSTSNLSTNDFDQQHLWHPYASLPPTYPNIVIDHAEGIYIVTIVNPTKKCYDNSKFQLSNHHDIPHYPS